MKKVLIAVAIVVLLLVVAVVAIPFLIPKDRIVARAAQEVEQATGRSLSVEGDVGISIFPNVGLELNDVTFANMEGGEEPYMAHVDTVTLSARLIPLFSGELVVDTFVLTNPDIRLEVTEDGRANWALDLSDATEREMPPADSEPQADGEGGMNLPQGELTLGDVRIDGGRLSYRDAATGTVEEVSDISLVLGLESLDSPFSIDGSARWREEDIGIDGEVTTLRRLLEQQPSQIAVAVSSAPLGMTFEGEGQIGGAAALDGAVTLDVPSLRGLVAWVTGEPLDLPGEGLESFALAGTLSASDGRAALADARLLLDAIEGNGSFAVETNGERPKIIASLEVSRLDVNPYLPQPDEGASQAANDDQPPPVDQDEAAQQAAARDWSDAPIDVSGLGALDADLRFSADAIVIGDIETAASELAVSLDNRLLTATLERFGIYEGEGQGVVEVNARSGAPAIAAEFAMSGLQVEPLLIAVADFNRLTGEGNIDFDIETQGASERALIEGLNGRGAFRFTDGAIRGINLAQMIRNATAAFRGEQVGDEPLQTDFSELGGTVTIENGIVINNDLSMLSPLLRIEGAGRVDLPAKEVVSYRVTPRAVASLEGQGGQGDLSGIMVPVIVQGPFDNLSFRPDVEGIIRQNIGEPEELLRQLQDRALGGGSGEGAQDGAGDGAGDGTGESLEDRARDSLRRLLPGAN